MKRRNNEKDRLRSIASKTNPIPFVLKIVSVTVKFLKTHQKKQLCRVESTSLSLERDERDSNKYDEKDTSLSKVASIPFQSKERDCNTEKGTSLSKLDSIPLDLEIEILARLPAKSLVKFQCVSKIWSSIIRSQSFVDSFFSMSSSRTQSRFLISFSKGALPKIGDNLMFISSASYDREEASCLITNVDLILPFDSYLDRCCNCSSVHGLIGCAKSGPFIVCNPSTGKVTILPYSGSHTSLGYDPVGDQFKALILLSHPHLNHDFLVHEVLTLGGDSSSWTRSKVTSPPYYTVTKTISINGFVFFGAWTPTRDKNPVIVCFDVRHESISFIKAPVDVVYWEGESILIDYKGKLAAITRHPYHHFSSFNFWILEDMQKHDWSKQTFTLPFSLGLGTNMISSGINKAGEIIFASRRLSRDVQPFYIFYYNVERKDIRKVILKGIADDGQFRRRYGFGDEVCVYISPEHVESIASL
ncbi:PREDICTED: F-box protein At1g30790-like [Camelina sativa]|uniref:F-box protein At1g30790-like n=1 Tax=Camelina sativa TaxID=90675 RepID=A0ABM0VYC0_CAMSA|nr:PREDICTED: F-box protein At1g30790-like [Camelina sativa]